MTTIAVHAAALWAAPRHDPATHQMHAKLEAIAFAPPTPPGCDLHQTPEQLTAHQHRNRPGRCHTVAATAKTVGFDPSSMGWRHILPEQIRPPLASEQVNTVPETVTGSPWVRAVMEGREPVALDYGTPGWEWWSRAHRPEVYAVIGLGAHAAVPPPAVPRAGAHDAGLRAGARR